MRDFTPDEEAVRELADCLCKLWAGGGEMGVYTVARQRDRLEVALEQFLDRARAPGNQ